MEKRTSIIYCIIETTFFHYLQYEKEAKLAAKESKKRKTASSNESTGEEDLFKAIQSRQSSRAAQQNNFLDKLAEKYSTKPTKGRKK